jgi:renalase
VTPTPFLVVGAGISGLLLGRRLHDAGRTVVLLDKGRSCGGRMSTRRDGEARFDHGAQFFTTRDPRFAAWGQHWQAYGVSREWYRQAPGETEEAATPRFIGGSGISAIPKALAEGLDVRVSAQVEHAERSGDHWAVRLTSGETLTCTVLILTAPLPQSLSLAASLDTAAWRQSLPELSAIRYARGLAVMLHLDRPSALPGPGAMKLDHPDLAWIGDNQKKGISATPAITLHASPAYAEAHWESPDAVRAPPLIAAALPHLNAEVLEYRCHRWGFAFPLQIFPRPFFFDPEANLLLAGDAFGGPRVEGAALSALAAADHLLSL